MGREEEGVIEMVIKYLLCTAGGVAIGYYLAHGHLEKNFQELLDRETVDIRDHYRRKYDEKVKEDEEFAKAALEAAETIERYQGVTIAPSVLAQEMEEVVRRDESQGDPEVEKATEYPEAAKIKVREKPARKDVSKVNYNAISTPSKAEQADEPKNEVSGEPETEIQTGIITKQAFIDNEFGYDQFSITYFAGDDVLANEEDEPMKGNRVHMLGREVVEKIKVGREAMDGEDTIFVRNHTGNWEFEVTRSEGKFSDEVGAESG